MGLSYKKLEESYNDALGKMKGLETELYFCRSNKKMENIKIIEEALKACDEYNWHDKISMRFALDNIKKILKKA